MDRKIMCNKCSKHSVFFQLPIPCSFYYVLMIKTSNWTKTCVFIAPDKALFNRKFVVAAFFVLVLFIY